MESQKILNGKKSKNRPSGKLRGTKHSHHGKICTCKSPSVKTGEPELSQVRDSSDKELFQEPDYRVQELPQLEEDLSDKKLSQWDKGTFLKLAMVLLDVSSSLQQINCTSQIGVIRTFAVPSTKLLMKILGYQSIFFYKNMTENA
ncbi:hypothetical protein HGM15179_012073 [Zosterops borbonicus]|uniref:Uncharacterized protein n=1 Tax=Zosterops borbonicus TaxID=364589 RepID=A0A8K1GBF5_9PASS|nr:hypothetical protein HGM15179_012073 [Zosterops borbonicus]